MRKRWLMLSAVLAVLSGPLVAKGKPGGGGGGGEEPAPDPAVAYLIISGSDVSGMAGTTGDLWVMNADGSNQTRLVAAECGRAGWSIDRDAGADGYQGELAFGSDVQGPGLYRIRPDGTGLTKVVATPFVPVRAAWSPVAAPDGEFKIAFQARVDSDGDGSPDKNDIFLVNEDGTGLINWTNTADASERSPSWSPDATQLAFSEGIAGDTDVLVVELGSDGPGLLELGRKDVTAAGPLSASNVQWLEWARGSDRLVVQDNGGSGLGDLWIIDVTDPSAPTNITGDYEQLLTHNATPTWSPDDTEILFAGSNDLHNHGSLWIVAADGTSKDELVRRGRGKSDVARDAPSWRP